MNSSAATKAANATVNAGRVNGAALAGPKTMNGLGNATAVSVGMAQAPVPNGVANAAAGNATATAKVANAAANAARANGAAAQAMANATRANASAGNAVANAAINPSPANMNGAARAANGAAAANASAAANMIAARAAFKDLAKALKAAGVSANNLKRNVNNA